MTQEELDQIPERTPSDDIGPIFLEEDEPMMVTDEDGVTWGFAKDLDTGEKVKIRETY